MNLLLAFFPNDHLVVWLLEPLTGEGSFTAQEQALLERIRRGDWQLPPEAAENFEIPPGLTFAVVRHGDLNGLHPSRPLREKTRAPKVELTDEQRQILRLMAQGKTCGQICFALRHHRRWFYYQVAEIKLKMGVTTRAEMLRRFRPPAAPKR